MNVNIVINKSFRYYYKYNQLILSNKLLKTYSKQFPLCQYTTSTALVNITSNNSFFNVKKNKEINKKTRLYCTENGPPSNKLPPLMNFPKLRWPSLIKSIKNFILATFIIRPYLDNEFNLSDFVNGSKKAVEVVSNKISEGDLKSLEGLVTNDLIPTVQQAVSLMSLAQREQIAVNIDDIYFTFPYQVGVIFNEDDQVQRRFVEITMVYHILKGLSIMRSRGEEPPLNMGMLPEYQYRMSICNYRFIREFTKGVESDWTINLLNHFKPIDEFNENELNN